MLLRRSGVVGAGPGREHHHDLVDCGGERGGGGGRQSKQDSAFKRLLILLASNTGKAGKHERLSVPQLQIANDCSLLFVPDDALEGWQDRLHRCVDWTLTGAAIRHHQKKCLRNNRVEISFSEAFEKKVKNSVLGPFVDEKSTLSMQEHWDITLPIATFENKVEGTDEAVTCFTHCNNIINDYMPLLLSAVKANDRKVIKRGLSKANLLRLTDSQMTHLDKKLKTFKCLATLVLCGNYISEIHGNQLPSGLRALEMQANAVTSIDFIKNLPEHLLYLGLSKNVLKDEGVLSVAELPRYLTCLDLSDNDICDLLPLLQKLVLLPNLTGLQLAGNPCAMCAAYAVTTLSILQNLKWLDRREVLPTDRIVEDFEPNPMELKGSYFIFSVIRIISPPVPPKTDKGVTATFHMELELPLLDSKRRQFLMRRRYESLTEVLSEPEPENISHFSAEPSLGAGEQKVQDNAKKNDDMVSNSEESDIFAKLALVNPLVVNNFTIFESPKVPWSKLMTFPNPTLKILCPDLTALRDTFRSTITLRLVYSEIKAIVSKKPENRKSIQVQGVKSQHEEKRVTIATIKCPLENMDWSQPQQHFHWDDSLGTDEAINWRDGDLRCLLGSQAVGSGSMAGAPHEKWGNQLEYLLSCLGYAVGIGNLWRFPYLCYRNGGGAFLIPYFLTMFICGIPLVYLETSLGQFSSSGCISIFNINPLFKGAGYAVVVLNVVCVIYFAAIMAYPVLYLYHSFSSPLPWTTCGNPWNTDKCYEITGNSSFFTSNGSVSTPEDEFFHRRLLQVSSGIHEIGGIVWPVFWCNVICWIIIYLCICNGVKSVGKIVYFTVLFPYVVLTVLLIRGVTLPGAWQGIMYYILPDWNQLTKPKVWADAATQLFFSLGPGWGGLISMASFNEFHYKNLRPSVIIPFVNSGTSIWAGFVVFSILGFAATKAGVPVGEVATAGHGLAFVTYPAVVSMMSAPNFWAVTFFIMLFFLGIDTMFVTIEAIIAGLLDEFSGLRPRKRWVTLASCIVLFLLSNVCMTEGGLHVIGLLDAHVAIAVVPIVCLLELIAAVYTYGVKRLAADLLFMTGAPLSRFWLVLWRYIVPIILVLITVYSLREASGWAGWSIAMVSVICIPIHAAKLIYKSEGTFIQRLRKNMQTSPEWGPTDPDIRQRWMASRQEYRLPLKEVIKS